MNKQECKAQGTRMRRESYVLAGWLMQPVWLRVQSGCHGSFQRNICKIWQREQDHINSMYQYHGWLFLLVINEPALSPPRSLFELFTVTLSRFQRRPLWWGLRAQIARSCLLHICTNSHITVGHECMHVDVSVIGIVVRWAILEQVQCMNEY